MSRLAIFPKSKHLGNEAGHALGVLRYPPPVMLSYHRCVGMAELPGHPFDRNVTRKHLAGKGVATLVRPAVPDFCFFQVSGKPVAQRLSTSEQAASRAVEKKPDLHLLRRDVVALDNGNLYGSSFLGYCNNLPHQLESRVYQLDNSHPRAFFGDL